MLLWKRANSVVFGGGLRILLARNCRFSNVRNKSTISNSTKNENLILNLDAKQTTSKISEKLRKKKKIEWSSGSIAMLAIPVFAFSLGCWQVFRLQWKLELIEHLKSRLSQKAGQLPNDLTSVNLEDLEYSRVEVTGQFLHDREFVISPRGRFDPGKPTSASAGSLLSENELSSHGGHLITPFRLKTTGQVILINRGWIPSFLFSTDSRQKTNPKGIVTLEAIVRKTETRPQFVGQNIPEQNIWYYRDLEQMAKTHQCLPVWLDAAYETTVPGGPIGGQTNINVRNEHLNYLTTWYTLTLVTMLMWFNKFRK